MVDFNLQPGQAVINREIDLILQQIDILFDTTQGDLQTDIDFGTDYEYLLYNLRYNESELRTRIIADICSIELFGYSPSVKIGLYKGTERDILLIEIELSKHNNTYKKTYKIS